MPHQKQVVKLLPLHEQEYGLEYTLPVFITYGPASRFWVEINRRGPSQQG